MQLEKVESDIMESSNTIFSNLTFLNHVDFNSAYLKFELIKSQSSTLAPVHSES